MAVIDGRREERAAKNQSMFREVNERVKELTDPTTGHPGLVLFDWVCECADETCVQRIALTLREYESVREIPTCFAVAASSEHFLPAVERIVSTHPRYWVVQKERKAATIAEELDPRSTPT
jgi:hypothetical protein